MRHILRHFHRTDPVIHSILRQSQIVRLIPNPDPTTYFRQLCREILGQQLSTKAATTIFGRFVALFTDNQPTPADVLALPDDQLRTVGLSWSKIKYVKDLAAKIEAQQLDLASLSKLPEEEVIKSLIQVKGIGRWTAEMFLIFTLGREDVFSVGDLGLRRAVEKLYGLPVKTPLQEYERRAQLWAPYRSYASLALWESVDNNPNLSEA